MKGMTKRHEEKMREKLEEPTRRVETFESRNWVRYVNKNIVSIVRFYSGPVRFTIGWLDGIDKMIRQHLTHQWALMKRAWRQAGSILVLLIQECPKIKCRLN